MVIKLGLRDLPPFLFAGTRMLIAAAVLLPFAAGAGLRAYGPRDWGRVALIGLLQIGVPYGLSASALIAPISAIGAIPLLDTTVAVMLGALVLGEKLGWPLLAGGVLVLSGAALANQVPAEPAPEAA